MQPATTAAVLRDVVCIASEHGVMCLAFLLFNAAHQHPGAAGPLPSSFLFASLPEVQIYPANAWESSSSRSDVARSGEQSAPSERGFDAELTPASAYVCPYLRADLGSIVANILPQPPRALGPLITSILGLVMRVRKGALGSGVRGPPRVPPYTRPQPDLSKRQK